MELAIDFKFLLNSIFFTWALLNHHVRSTIVERSSYIVHMDKNSMPKAFTNHKHWHTSTVRSLSENGVQSSEGSRSKPQLIYSYENVLHGFSALLSQEELENLKISSGFVSAYIDRQLKHRTTHTPKFLSLNPSSGIWPTSNYGKDVIVGVVDSGIWPESQSFGDDGMTAIPSKWKGSCEEGEEFNMSMCNLKLIGARYYNKGFFAANKPGTKLPSMNSSRDTEGHGTHTASIAAGNFVNNVSYFGYAKGTASGIAPYARLAVYKVLWNETTQSSDALAAIDQAVADGVDVISLSLGADEEIRFYEDAIAIACFGAMEKGVVVTHAGGNTGPGLGSLFDSMPWTVTVGAGSVDRWLAGKLILKNGLIITGWSAFPARVLIENIPLIYNETLSSCNSTELLAQAPIGIIICEDIGDVFTQLHYVLLSSNIIAAIYISDPTSISQTTFFPWPGLVISPKDGYDVINYAKINGSKASMKFQETILGKNSAPYVPDYSSRGPSRAYSGILKPDLVAPGSLVLAAWVPTVPVALLDSRLELASDYQMKSGTSMACPHVAGVTALLKSAHPEWTPAMVRSAMMTTANPLDNTGNTIRDQGNNFTFSSPLVMGSGHVDPNRALDPGLVYDTTPQDYVNMLCHMNYTEKQILAVTRSAQYNCSSPSTDVNYPSFIALYSNTSSTKSVQTFKRILTSVVNGTTTYHAEVIAPTGTNITITPSVLVFDQIYDKKAFTMSIEYESDKNAMVTYGSLVWADNNSHMVRSPIVISPDLQLLG